MMRNTPLPQHCYYQHYLDNHHLPNQSRPSNCHCSNNMTNYMPLPPGSWYSWSVCMNHRSHYSNLYTDMYPGRTQSMTVNTMMSAYLDQVEKKTYDYLDSLTDEMLKRVNSMLDRRV